MSEPIEFPLNFERYLEMGQAALAEGLYAEAFVNFEAAYNLKEDIQANLALVNLLMARSDFLQAKQIADEMRGDYLTDEALFDVYLKLLIGNQEFIKGRKLLLKKQLEPQVKQALLAELEQGESFFQTFQQKERNERLALSAQLDGASFFQQAQTLQQLEKLPQTDYERLARKIISNNHCHVLLRNSLLESLVELKVEADVALVTLTQDSRVVELSHLGVITEQKSYQQAQSYLLSILEKSESDLNRQFQEELRLQFSFLYPLADELVLAPKLWVDLFLADYLGPEVVTDSDLQAATELYCDLQQEIRMQRLKMTL